METMKAVPPLIIRASKVPRIVACPASPSAEQGYPRTDSEPAQRGRRLHDMMALLLGVGPEAWPDVEAAVKAMPLEWRPEDSLAQLREAYEAVKAIEPDDPKLVTLIETPVDLAGLGLDVTGEDGQPLNRPDLVYLAPTFDGAVVVDYKFGSVAVEDPEKNDQLTTYAIGLAQAHGLETVEVAIVQPGTWKQDKRARAHTWTREQLRAEAQRIKAAVAYARTPKGATDYRPQDVPEVCGYCAHKEACPAAVAMYAAKAERVEGERMEDVKALVGPEPITVPIPKELLSLSVADYLLVGADTIARAEAALKEAEALEVVDQATADAAGRLSKAIRADNSIVEKQRVKLKAPVLEFGRAIDRTAEKAQAPWEGAAKLLDKKVDTWRRAEEAKRRAAEEAERQRQLEAQRKADEEKRRADELAREAQRKAEEAAQLKGKAAAKAAQEAAALSQQALQASSASQAAQAEAIAAPPVVALPPVAVHGFKTKDVTIATIPDMSKVPAAWMSAVLMVNQKALDALVASGGLNAEKGAGWLVLTKDTVQQRGR